jgi:signal transduction histidine kinase
MDPDVGETAKIHCVGADGAVRSRLERLGHAVVSEPRQADLWVVGGTTREGILAEVGRLRGVDPVRPLLVVAPVRSSRWVTAAVHAGVTDWLDPDGSDEELAGFLESHLMSSRLARESQGLRSFVEEHGRSLAADRQRMQERLAAMASELSDAHARLETAHRQLRGRVSQLVMLYQIGRDLTARPNWDDALSSFLNTLTGFLGAEGAALFLTSSAGSRVAPRSVCRLSSEEVERAQDWAGRRVASGRLDSDLVRMRDPGEGGELQELAPEQPWNLSLLPLCQRDRELGYLALKKSYANAEEFENDYYFLITIQTVLTEEVSSAQAMSELRKLKEFHERTFDHVRSGIFTVDGEGAVRFANRRVRELFGRDPSDTLVAEFLDLGPEAPSIHTWMNGIVTGSTRSVDAWLRPLDGSAAIPVSLVGSPLPGELPGETHVVFVLEDQRQRRALDAERRRASRQKEHLIMAAEWAHDVRTPLTGILHSAELLADALGPDCDKRRHFDVVVSEVQRINGLVSNFLDYARPAELKCTDVPVRSILDAVVELQAGPAASRGVDLRLDVKRLEDCHLELDASAMKQVLLNLVANALDASPERSEVVLRAESCAVDALLDGEPSVRIDVVDAGAGVAEANIDRLFIPFFTTKSQGTGLGLAISDKVARAHGGHLRYFRENQRTVMRIVLPSRGAAGAGVEDRTSGRRAVESALEARG